MIGLKYISSYIRISTISLLLLMSATNASAQMKFFSLQKDSIPVFRGFALSFDLVGAAMMQFSDYGHYEGALRVNIHDEWFPVFELGYGKADHERDEVTRITYRTKAPYFRVGIDKNLVIYSTAHFKAMADEIGRLSLADQTARIFRRRMRWPWI